MTERTADRASTLLGAAGPAGAVAEAVDFAAAGWGAAAAAAGGGSLAVPHAATTRSIPREARMRKSMPQRTPQAQVLVGGPARQSGAREPAAALVLHARV